MIEINSKKLKAHILPYGATLAGLWHVDAPFSLVLGSPQADAYAADLAYFGAIVGPVANRVAGGKIVVQSTAWQMETNERANCLHSGSGGVHAMNWKVADRSAATVKLVLDLPHRYGGLPGNRRLTAQYRVSDDGFLSLSLCAVSEADTVMNLAHHPYWNLDDTPNLRQHELLVCADHYLPVNEQLLPTGEISAVATTALDFTKPRTVPSDFALDYNYCLAIRDRATPELAAVLRGSSGMTLRIETTAPGLQVYSGGGLSATKWPLYDDRKLRPYAGLALEPQGWPDSPNHEQFPQIWLRSGETYRQETRYFIS